jgi:beta-phosphoglucomutase
MTIKGFIFDLDGVIVDTARLHYLAWKELANELGFEFTPEHNERLKGVSRMRSLEILLEIGGIDLPEQEKIKLAERKNQRYRQLVMQLTPADMLPGAMDFLRKSRQLGLKLALASASKNTPLILQRIGLDTFFDAVVDGNRVSKAKPDPEVFLVAANDLRLEPEQCVVFEDAVAGVEAAHRAGMKVVGIGKKDVLKDAEMVVASLAEITPEQVLQYFVEKN